MICLKQILWESIVKILIGVFFVMDVSSYPVPLAFPCLAKCAVCLLPSWIWRWSGTQE